MLKDCGFPAPKAGQSLKLVAQWRVSHATLSRKMTRLPCKMAGMLPDQTLLPWLMLVGLTGCAFNYWLLRRWGPRGTARAWLLALVVGLVVHVSCGAIVEKVAFRLANVPAAEREAVGYFVFPHIGFFMTLPLAIYVYYQPRRSDALSA